MSSYRRKSAPSVDLAMTSPSPGLLGAVGHPAACHSSWVWFLSTRCGASGQPPSKHPVCTVAVTSAESPGHCSAPCGRPARRFPSCPQLSGTRTCVTTSPPCSSPAGRDVKVVQARLRHASAKTTLDTYAHLWPTPTTAPVRPSTRSCWRGLKSQPSSTTRKPKMARRADALRTILRTFRGLRDLLKSKTAGQRGPKEAKCRSRARTRAGAAAAARGRSRWCACSRSTSRSGRV
jgi:hypothetical protein